MEFTIDCSTCLHHQTAQGQSIQGQSAQGQSAQGQSAQGQSAQGQSAQGQEQSESCQDCIVMFLTSREPDEAVVVDAAEFAALRRLANAGLIPSLQHEEKAEVRWITDTEREVG